VIAAVTDVAFDRVSALAPEGVEVRRLDGNLDGVSFLVPTWEARLDLSGLESLRVVQTLSAGTDWVEDLVPPWATLCNARGARDVPVAEWVVAALLGATSGLLAASRDRVWRHTPPAELAGSHAVIVGFGSIGRAVATRLEALGVRTTGVGRSRRDELPLLLPEADAVILLTPLTPETRGMVDAEFLALMPDGALFVNAGRGGAVDTDALLAELRSGRLRAVLDVVDPEPLPEGHPLWDAPGALAISAHHAGDSPEADDRAADLAADQLRRFVDGAPLLNVVREASSAR
jgi:phosphoglycerate dehydrogenase-like enzyme